MSDGKATDVETDNTLPLKHDPAIGALLLLVEKAFDKLAASERKKILSALRGHRKRRTHKAGDPPFGSPEFEAFIKATYPDEDKHRDAIRELRALRARAQFLEEAGSLLCRKKFRADRTQKIIEGFFKHGKVVKEIAEQLKVSQATVYRTIQNYRLANGMPKLRRGPKPKKGVPQEPAPAKPVQEVDLDKIIAVAARLAALELPKADEDG